MIDTGAPKLTRSLYYGVKPHVPFVVRRAVRSWFARRKRRTVDGAWPILPGSERPPPGWVGWPGGKKFAFVLSHDVEGQSGLDKCRQLMELEMKWGFRSCFNFIPEGEYRVSKAFRDELVSNGFEIGVHDLHHDGKLYGNRKNFVGYAAKINGYMKEWGAVGFRSGFMFHNLDWFHDLKIEYDASTFDTDPFEPQPDGVHTIFPFWNEGADGQGYVELPYTLPQDFTLFLLFGEKTPDVWLRKFDWVASHGGMVLVIVHPDYLRFPGEKPSPRTFPVEHYEALLKYARDKYAKTSWPALPKEVARFVASPPIRPLVVRPPRTRKKVWIDLDNTPHVPLFIPIAKELERQGYEVVLTARDAFQVCELAAKKGLVCRKIGRHSGKNKLRKVFGLFVRAAQLAPVIWQQKPDLALSHGSRAQIIICNLFGIPTLLMADYEFAAYPPFMRPTWEMAPEIIPDSSLSCPPERIKKYPGIKEDIYVPNFQPDAGFLEELHLNPEDIIAVVRPPATEAHYHNPDAEPLLAHFMARFQTVPGVKVILVPRNKKQGEQLLADYPAWFEGGRTVIPATAVDGLNLIWHADLVISGGGTMNREAAALGVPVYSVFRGKIGAVDRQLEKEGRLKLVATLADVDKIAFVRRARALPPALGSQTALTTVVKHISDVIAWSNNGAGHPLSDSAKI
jgi:predicted glycosyltransferase